jgi:Rrf2 family protein
VRVSQRLDYAVRALVLLAEQPPGEFVAAGDLAERLNMPRRFVEQQVTQLARAGIVECRRGSMGGCALSRSPEAVSMQEIVVALHGDVLDVPHHRDSASAELWQQAEEALADFLSSVNLAQLAERQREIDALSAPMYYI